MHVSKQCFTFGIMKNIADYIHSELGLLKEYEIASFDDGFSFTASRVLSIRTVSKIAVGANAVLVSGPEGALGDPGGLYTFRYSQPCENVEGLLKGEEIPYLNHTIKMCTNDDGLVLLSPVDQHRGNYGTNLDLAKKYALVYFLLGHHELRTIGASWVLNGSRFHEWFLFKKVVEKKGLKMPDELSCSNDGNFSILFNGKKLYE